MKILLSLASRKLRDKEGINPKNYPYSKKLIELLHLKNIETVQVRTDENEILPTKEVKTNLSFKELAKVILECDGFISIDNFIQHYATYLGKRGVVVFGQSDPLIYGYPQNINLLKDRKYLRTDQFGIWESVEFTEESFVSPENIALALAAICCE
ncbi:MAG: hypothetical protein M0R80_08345 [Proteobacteria bacterium]|jgi:hypothetical protein|nr:hypothetical protein [Pseudomonadota bacterium]